MFVAAYWWKVHPGKEAQFRAAWRRGTELIRERYGSLGSRLHWDEAEGRFVGIAEWPDRATWQRAFDARMVYDEPETRAAFVDAIREAGEEPLLLLEVTDDLLVNAASPAKRRREGQGRSSLRTVSQVPTHPADRRQEPQ